MRKLLIIVLLVSLMSCQSQSPFQYKKWEIVKTDTVTYRIFYVNDMPCLWASQYIDASGDGGISCDWSKYQSKSN